MLQREFFSPLFSKLNVQICEFFSAVEMKMNENSNTRTMEFAKMAETSIDCGCVDKGN